jgi:leucyl-tRNA synthetase
MPVDLYVGGAEHAVLHLLYARFWHKVLYDAGLVHTREPFQRLFNQGMILGITYRTKEGRIVQYQDIKWDGETPTDPRTGDPLEALTEKMSKSRGNVINPDDIVRDFGADTLRLYEMFMGPLDVTKPWNMRDVAGVHRFLQRAWRVFVDENDALRPNLLADGGSPELERALHQCIKKVTEDLSQMAFNTAISAMMVFVNESTKDPTRLNKSQGERFLLLLAPFAPHIAEELWERLGHNHSLAYEPWPKHDPAVLRQSEIEIPIQVNGKLRSRITAPASASREEVERLALADERVKALIAGKPVKKIVVVPGKMVNVVA